MQDNVTVDIKNLTDCASTFIWQMVDNCLVMSYQTLQLNLCNFDLWRTITDRLYVNNTHFLQEMKDNT